MTTEVFFFTHSTIHVLFACAFLTLASLTEHLGSQQEHGFLSNSPGFGIAQLWAKERTMASGSSKNDELDIVTLPVGVKLSKFQCDQSPNTHPETPDAGTTAATGHVIFAVPFSDVRLEKVMGMCSCAVTFLRGKMDRSRKRGSNSISSRAALMLVSFFLLRMILDVMLTLFVINSNLV